jgi:hypothetical protein
MNRGPSLKYQVQEQIYDAKSMLDEQNFYNQRQGKPSELTRKLTYILGDYTKQYPLATMTTGAIGYNKDLKSSQVELDDIQYTYPVMGADTKVSVVADSLYTDGDKPGIGNTEFIIPFDDNWIKRFYIIQSEHGIQAYVNQDPIKVGNKWHYTVVLASATADDYCPLTELVGGVRWTDLFTAVPESESRSTEHRMVTPGLYKNQMGICRAGMSWAGNAANKMMNITIKGGVSGKETNVWMDLFMWQFEKEWLSQCEHQYWYSRYNRLANGTINMKDIVTGKVVPLGSGLLEQITNKSTYSTLTYESLQNKIGDALFGQPDADNMTITLMTGRGGMRAIDSALKAAGAKIAEGNGFLGGDIASKFVSGSGYNLALGGFFDTFYHIDGYTIKVKHNPVFDHGKVAKASPRHPVSGLPLESYRMVFIDDNDYDGQPNLRTVCQTGRAMLDGVVKGLTPMPKSLEIKGNFSGDLNSALLASDVDKTSYTRLSTRGIQLLRANRCFDLQCVAGL